MGGGLDQYAITFEDDGAGDVGGMTFVGVGTSISTSIARDARGTVTGIADVTNLASASVWSLNALDAFGTPISTTYGDGTTVGRSRYQATGKLRQLSALRGTTVLMNETYEYDDLGRLSRRTPGAGANPFSYVYDNLDRLDSVERGGTVVEDFAYDALGNLTLLPGAELEYNEPQPHAVSSTIQGKTFHYDARGNQYLREGTGIVEGRQEIDYTWFNLPKLVRNGPDPDHPISSSSFLYGADLQLVRQTNEDGSHITHFGNIMRSEYDVVSGQSRLVVTIPLLDGNLATLSRVGSQPSSRLYTQRDINGSARAESSAGTTPTGSEYQAFGARTGYSSASGELVESFGSHTEDRRNGWVSMGSRLYDPTIGRFLSPDSMVPNGRHSSQGWNRYSYAKNSPMGVVDPLGFEGVPDVPPPPEGPGPSQVDLGVLPEHLVTAHVTPEPPRFDPTVITQPVQYTALGDRLGNAPSINAGAGGAASAIKAPDTSASEATGEGNRLTTSRLLIDLLTSPTSPMISVGQLTGGPNGYDVFAELILNGAVPGYSITEDLDTLRDEGAARGQKGWAIVSIAMIPFGSGAFKSLVKGSRYALKSQMLLQAFRTGMKVDDMHAHHIVMWGHRLAGDAQAVMSAVGLHLSDIGNGVWLDKSYHASLHTKAYAQHVNEALQTALSRAGDDLQGRGKQLVLEALDEIRVLLQSGKVFY